MNGSPISASISTKCFPAVIEYHRVIAEYMNEAIRSLSSRFEDEDGPDHFFRRQQPKARHRERETLEEKFLKLSVLVQVRPGWNRYTSPSPVQHSVCHAVRVQSNRALIRVCWFSSDFLQVRMSNSVTFFFPNKDFQMISVPRSCPVVDIYIYIYIYHFISYFTFAEIDGLM